MLLVLPAEMDNRVEAVQFAADCDTDFHVFIFLRKIILPPTPRHCIWDFSPMCSGAVKMPRQSAKSPDDRATIG